MSDFLTIVLFGIITIWLMLLTKLTLNIESDVQALTTRVYKLEQVKRLDK